MYGACCIIFYVHFFFLLIQKIDVSWAFEKNKIQSPHLAIDFLTSSIVISRSFALLLSLKCKQKLYQPQACSHFHRIFHGMSIDCDMFYVLAIVNVFFLNIQSMYVSKQILKCGNSLARLFWVLCYYQLLMAINYGVF